MFRCGFLTHSFSTARISLLISFSDINPPGRTSFLATFYRNKPSSVGGYEILNRMTCSPATRLATRAILDQPHGHRQSRRHQFFACKRGQDCLRALAKMRCLLHYSPLWPKVAASRQARSVAVQRGRVQGPIALSDFVSDQCRHGCGCFDLLGLALGYFPPPLSA